VGAFYWYLHLTGRADPIPVDGTVFDGQTVHLLEGLRHSRGSSQTKVDDVERAAKGEDQYGG